MADLLKAVEEAQKLIAGRNRARGSGPPPGNPDDFRRNQALEVIGDELTLLRAEVETLRYLFATYAARP